MVVAFGKRSAVALSLLSFILSITFAYPAQAQTATFSVSGKVTSNQDGTGTPFAGVTITLIDDNTGAQLATQQTDGSGNYSFTALAAGGSYRVRPSQQGFAFNPASRGYGNLSQNFSGEHFQRLQANPTPSPTPTPTPSPTPTPTPGPRPTPEGTIQFNTSSVTAAEGSSEVDITVTRTGGDPNAFASVRYTTRNGSATEKGDFTTTLGLLTFAPGEGTKTLRVLLIDDRYATGLEAFGIELSQPVGATLGATSAATLNITDNDVVDGPSPVRWDQSFESNFSVRQHYLDFFSRESDAAGLQFWMGQIAACGSDASCQEVRRVNTSAAFFLSIEFQETGYLVYRAYKAAFGNLAGKPVPVRYYEFLSDTQEIGRGVVVGSGDWRTQLENNKQAYFLRLVDLPQFAAEYPAAMSAESFVDKLNQNAGGALSADERNVLVADLHSGAKTRAQVLRAVAEDRDLSAAEFNKAFVLMQYFGYLRRNPDDAPDADFRGWEFWLSQLDRFGGDFERAEMVKAFLLSAEYKDRFGR